MAPRRKPRAVTRAAHVRHLLALDAANVMKRIVTRQHEMVALFSRLRDRAPMLEAIRSWYLTITFSDLAELEPLEQTTVSRFYELLDELRWYLQYTEDMPTQVLLKVATFIGRLETGHRQLVVAIGPASADGAPVVEAQVVSKRRVSS
jgi:hypothetical protein